MWIDSAKSSQNRRAAVPTNRHEQQSYWSRRWSTHSICWMADAIDSIRFEWKSIIYTFSNSSERWLGAKLVSAFRSRLFTNNCLLLRIRCSPFVQINYTYFIFCTRDERFIDLFSRDSQTLFRLTFNMRSFQLWLVWFIIIMIVIEWIVVLRRMCVRLNFTSQVFPNRTQWKEKERRKCHNNFEYVWFSWANVELLDVWVWLRRVDCRWTMIEAIKMLWRTANRQFIP